MSRAILRIKHAYILIIKIASLYVLSIVVFDYTELKI